MQQLKQTTTKSYSVLGRLKGSQTRLLVRSQTGENFVAYFLSIKDLSEETIQQRIRFLKSLSHANVLKTYDAFKWKNNLSMMVVAELHDELSLADQLGNQPLSMMAVMVGIARGLHYLHSERRMVHSRLTPERIYLKEKATPLIGGVQPHSQQAQEDSQRLTTVYDAPELQQGIVSYECDIFSAGVIFLEMALSMRVCSKNSLADNLLLVRTLKDMRLRNLITRMLSTDASSRPSAKVILEILADPAVQPVSPLAITEMLIHQTRLFWHHKCSQHHITKLYTKYQQLIESQAAQNAPQGLFLIGRMFGLGITRDKNKQLSRDYYTRAADLGELAAYCNVFVVDSEEVRANEYLLKGVQRKDVRSLFQYARVLKDGNFGFKKDLPKAIEIMSELSFPDTNYFLARMKAEDQGLPSAYCPDLIRHYKKGAEQGHKRAVEGYSQCMYEQNNKTESLKYVMIANAMEGESITSEAGLVNSVGASYHKLSDKLSSRRWFLLSATKSCKEAKRNLLNVMHF